MQRIQRKVGAFLPRSADDSEVGEVLKDWHNADKALSEIIDATKDLRKAWTEFLQHNCGLSATTVSLYSVLPPTDPTASSDPAITPRDTLAKTVGFRDAMADLRERILMDLMQFEKRIILPGIDCRNHISVYNKSVKRREDRKLDWERYRGRVESLEKKKSRSDRDNIALAKHKADFESAEREYHISDEQLKSTLPGITNAVYSLLPLLLESQILVQSTLLGHYYSALYTFCTSYSLPVDHSWTSIPPSFSSSFSHPRRAAESISSIATGKAIKSPFSPDQQGYIPTGRPSAPSAPRRSSTQPLSPPGLSLPTPSPRSTSPPPPPKPTRPGASPRFNSYTNNSSTNENDPPGPPRPPRPRASPHSSSPNLQLPSPPPVPPPSSRPSVNLASKPSFSSITPSTAPVPGPPRPGFGNAMRQTSAPAIAGAMAAQIAASGPGGGPGGGSGTWGGAGSGAGNGLGVRLNGGVGTAEGYRMGYATGGGMQPGLALRPAAAGGTTRHVSSDGAVTGLAAAGSAATAAMAAKKKRPPPPPPPKKRVQQPPPPPEDVVVALYEFEGAEEGDLRFQEGERIRVVKRTESRNDWWEGVRVRDGARGVFPANYCKEV